MNTNGIKCILGMVFFALIYSCDYRREVYDESSVWVRFNIDWSMAGLNPNGATICVYPHRSDLSPFFYQTNYSLDSVLLKRGDYSFVIFNETFTDHDYILFRGIQKYQTLEAYTTTSSYSLKGRSETYPVCNMPDPLAVSSIDKFEITRDMITKNTTQTIKCIPQNLVSQLKTTAHVTGMKYIASKGSLSSLSGLSGGIFLATGKLSSQLVTYYSILNDKTYDASDANKGTLKSYYTIFQPKDKLSLSATMFFKLRNNTDYPPIVRNVEKIINQTDLFINLSFGLGIDNDELIVLPYVPDMSGIEVNVGDWGENINIDTPVY